ncbi:hypothetical protein L6452_31661 [Arctium lappa]|uniref:Uncharacterized protein n=1 Tax=Arctium lappa TaxID=4217 RepID=A0ACB8Z1N7_ARCLA|nr:hypothetical protein L6452_31661 [Arctium lappa]
MIQWSNIVTLKKTHHLHCEGGAQSTGFLRKTLKKYLIHRLNVFKLVGILIFNHIRYRQVPPLNQMAAKPLTTAAIAMTEKKMDMALDDIIKMSKTGTGTNKAKKQRIPNKNQKFSNNVAQDKPMKLKRYMDSRSSLRQGVLAQRRSSFQGNQFPLAAEAARKAAVAPIRNRNFNRNQAMTSYRSR